MVPQGKFENSILYLDDEQANLDGFKFNFRKDYHVFLAKNVSEAFNILKNNKIKIVLSDNRMPDMSGTEFFEILTSTHPNIIRILVTAYADTDAVMQAINKGNVYKFITKPWNKNELQVTLDNAFEAFDLKKQNLELITNLTNKNLELEEVNYKLLVEIGERKKAEEELAQHRDNLELLVKQRTEEIAIINEDLAITNHELIAVNEELNAINEEIELANKKLNKEIDIRKQVQEMLAESEDKFRGLIEQSSEGIMLIDLSGRIVDCNKSIANIMEVKQTDIIGQLMWDYDFQFLPVNEQNENTFSELKQATEQFTAHIENSHATTIEGYKITKAGTEKFISTVIFPVITPKGKFIGRIVRDITEKMKQEEELRKYKGELENLVVERTAQLLESEQRLRTLSDNLPGGAIYRGYTKPDDTDYLIYASASIADITGISTDDLLASIALFFNKIHPDDIRRFIELRHECMQSLEILDTEIRYTKSEIDQRWLHIRIMYKKSSDNLVWWDGYVIDITKRKIAEKVANEREELIRSIQHGIASKTGEKLFETIVLNISETLHSDYTFIAEVSETNKTKVNTLSLCSNGKISENIEYDLTNTPCEIVLSNKHLSYKSGLLYHYPDPVLINSLQVEGYVGVPLFNSQHKTIGIMVAMFKKPIEDVKLAEQILDIFSSRVGAEMERIKAESDLKEREIRFRTLFELSPNMAFITSLEGTILEANSTFIDMLGSDRKEIIGLSSFKLNIWDKEVMTGIFEKVQKTGKVRNMELSFPNKNGEPIYSLLSVEPVIINGETTMLSTATDITERKKAEEAIQQYSDIAYNMQVALNVFYLTDFNDNNSLVLIKANPAAERIFSAKIKNLLNKHIYEIYPKLKGYGIEKILANVIKTGIPYENEEFRYFQDNGEIQFFMVKAFKVPNNCVGVLIEDISRRKRVEKALIENEERYRALFDKSPNGIHLIGTNGENAGKLISFNPIVSQMLGYTDDELIGMSIDTIIRDHPMEQKQLFSQKLMAGETITYETNFYKKNGVPFAVEVTASVISLGDQLFILGIDRDISERKRMENAIRENERKFRAIFNQTFEMMGILSPDGRLLDANKMLFDFSNSNPDQIIGHYFWESPWWVNTKEMQEKLQKYVLDAASNKFVRFETSLVSKDGQSYQFDFSIKPIRDENGIVIFLVSEGRDITDIKTAEKKLKENVHFLSTLVETIPLPIFYKDVKGQYLGCNTVFEIYTGYKRGNLIGKTDNDLYPEEFAKIYTLADNDLLKNNASQRYEGQMIYADGTVKDVIFNKAIFTDAEGNILGLIGAMFDITELRRNEQLVRESQQKLLNIFNSSSDGILITDFNFEIIDLNLPLLKMVGFESYMEIDKKPIDLVLPEYHEKINERTAKLLKGEKLPIIELEIFDKNGSKIPIEVDSKIIEHGGQEAILNIIHDITERKNIEKKLFETIISTEEKERERFAGDLHDEVGPLLSSLKMYISLLAETEDKKKKEYIIPQIQTLIKESIQTVREISNDLSPHVLNNYGCVAAINSFLTMKRDFLQINFNQNIENKRFQHNKEVVIYRIIKELVNNTIKHAKATKIDIKLNEDDTSIKLNYKDNGIGFDIDATVATKTGSIGLLNIMSRIKTVDGKYKISSSKNKGLSFELIIPLA